MVAEVEPVASDETSADRDDGAVELSVVYVGQAEQGFQRHRRGILEVVPGAAGIGNGRHVVDRTDDSGDRNGRCRPGVGAAQLRRDVRRGVQHLRRIRQTNREAARCAVVFGNRHEAQLRRGRQDQRTTIGQAGGNHSPAAAAIGRVLPGALRRWIHGIADDGHATQRRRRRTSGDGIGGIGVVCAGDQCRNGGARRVAGVFVDRRQSCCSARHGGVVDGRDGGAQADGIGQVRVDRRAAGCPAGEVRPAARSDAAGGIVNQTHAELSRRAVPVGGRQKT